MSDNGSGRVILRRGFPDEHRIRLLEDDVDTMETAFTSAVEGLRSDLRRVFWAVGSLLTTIVAGLAIALGSR